MLAARPLTENAPLHPVAVCGVVLSLMRARHAAPTELAPPPLNPNAFAVFLESYAAQIDAHAREIQQRSAPDGHPKAAPKTRHLLTPRALPPGTSPVQHLVDLADGCAKDTHLLPACDERSRLEAALREYRSAVEGIEGDSIAVQASPGI